MNVPGSTIVYLDVYVSMIKYILSFLCKRVLPVQIDIPNNVLFALVEFESFGMAVIHCTKPWFFNTIQQATNHEQTT